MPAKKTTWTGNRIRESFLKFFEKNNHKILPSSSLVPYNDPTVFLTTAGMQQMVPFFLGEETPPHIRLTTAQKCFRTVDIDEVGDASHLTFFEMLGNFSVGDYFKEGAITFAWELLTKVYGLAPEKLYPSVYPSDTEAIDLWQKIAGKKESEIVKLEDNWWDRGPTTPGPCGPDSEIYYDRGEALGCGKPNCAPGCDCPRYLEIWNLVFMQYNQDGKGGKEQLKKKNIDTGMGLERLSLVLQNKPTVFETDLFFPIITTFAKLIGAVYGKDEKTDRSLRVIADHGRALVFLAADGVLPSNEGRGYIFRRVLRRAVRHGKLLGLDKPFLSDAADTVIELMKEQYPELVERRSRIVDVLATEERKFSRTLADGLDILEKTLAELEQLGKKEVPGETIFRLFDTHGFPLELTREASEEKGFTLDEKGFYTHMEAQRKKSRNLEKFAIRKDSQIWQEIASTVPPTKFTGYEAIAGSSHVLALIDSEEIQDMIAARQITIVGENNDTSQMLILQETPFYAESGGQVGDTGQIKGPNGEFAVLDTQRPVSGIIVHIGHMTEGYVKSGDTVTTTVHAERREDTRKNHSATHLLHKALKDHFGEAVVQHGSLVEPDRLRFDFNFQRALTDDEITRLDATVNEMIRQNYPVSITLTPLEQAKRSGAMALFGEKYPDPVRVVVMGTSKELCGGTHVSATGQIGVYVTTQETSSSSGVRRIEALTGKGAEELLARRKKQVEYLADKLQTQPEMVTQKIEQLTQEMTEMRKELKRYRQNALIEEAERLAKEAQQVQHAHVVTAMVKKADISALHVISDHLRTKLGAAVVALASGSEDGAVFIVTVSQELTRQGIHAGKIAEQLATKIGGKGGGKPEAAQGGGKSTANLPEALQETHTFIAKQLG